MLFQLLNSHKKGLKTIHNMQIQFFAVLFFWTVVDTDKEFTCIHVCMQFLESKFEWVL